MALNKVVAKDFSPVLRVYDDGSVERLQSYPDSPPSPDDPITGVSSKDITISPHLKARLYLPNLTNTHPHHKLPILVYFHGGAFVVGSAYSSLLHHCLNLIVSQSKAIAVSVEYRLAPEHPLPIAFHDCWDALQWVASHLTQESFNEEPWLLNHGDFDKIYLGGDSAGATIVHDVVMRAGTEKLKGDKKIVGGFLSFPFFLGSKPIGSENLQQGTLNMLTRLWLLAYPSAKTGIDNFMLNPWAEDAPSLKNIGCLKLLVIVGEKDKLRDRGIKYCDEIKESGWEGKLELIEVEEEDHIFHIYDPNTEKAKNLIKRIASFIV